MKISNISNDGYQILDSQCPDRQMLHVPSGNLVRTINLFNIPTVGRPLAFSLYHNSRALRAAGDVGIGWGHSVQAQLEREDSSAALLVFTDETGRKRDFELVDGSWQLSSDSIFENLRLTDLGDGNWQIARESDSKTLKFSELGGTPIVARLTGVEDGTGSRIEYEFDDDQLVSITEPRSGRAITLDWEDDRIVGVTDPMGNQFVLTYNDDLLTMLEMPGGCLVEFGYDENNLISSRTDSESGTDHYSYDEDGRLTEFSFNAGYAQWEYGIEGAEEIADISPDNGTGGQYVDLFRVSFRDPRGKMWEFRFLPNQMLWREINPMGHHRRFYYDDRQNLLYSSQGFARKNYDDLNETDHDHPRDNINNQVRTAAWDEKGNLLQSIDSNGLVTAYSYGANSTLLSVYPGQAHYGLGGNWTEHFGSGGHLFCAYQSNGDDEASLPSYVASVDLDENVVPTHCELTLEQPVLLSTQVLDAGGRSVGHWTSEDQSLGFSISLNDRQAFNLSLYTTSLDQLDATGSVLDYPEFFGREIELSVTDLNGQQSFRVTQNASGVWVTFPVVGDEDHPIRVVLACPQSEHRPSVSALAFDAFEDRRVQMTYDPSGYLVKVTQPTSDPDREVASEYRYNADGTVSEARQVLRVAGDLVEERVTRMFYEDDSRNLTRVEDPLNGPDHPVQMEYDDNSNMVHSIDPDGRHMHFEYDFRGRVTKIQDSYGNATEITYDGRGLVTLVKETPFNETHLYYNGDRQLQSITDANGHTIEYSYFEDGLLQSIQDPDDHTVYFSYDDAGRLVEVTYPECNVQLPNLGITPISAKLRMAFDVWQRLTAVTSPNGNLDEVDQTNLLGAANLLRNGRAEQENGLLNQVPRGWQEARPDGFVANSVRDGQTFPLSVPDSLDADQSYAWVQRRPGGGVGGRYVLKGSAQSDLETQFRLQAVVRDFSGTLSERNAEVTLAANTPTEFSACVELPGDAQVSTRMPVFHQFRAAIVKPDSGTANAQLSDLQARALSQLSHYHGEYAMGSTGPDGAQTRVVRDRFGRVRRLIDPIFRTVDFTYDEMNRILSVTDSQGLTLQYEWDFLGNLTRFTDARDQETTFEYDDLNRVTKITQPDTDQFELFAYTPGGDLSDYTNCRDQHRAFHYDDAHRLVQIEYDLEPSGTESVWFHYEWNNLKTIIERNGDKLCLRYDVTNRLEQVSRVSEDGPSWSLKYTFDPRGNRSALHADLAVYGVTDYGGGDYGSEGYALFTAEYNERNQMSSLTDSAENETQFTYDIDGRLSQVDHPVEDLHTNHRYDLVGKLMETRVSLDSEELWKLNYSYNLAGERLSQHSVWDGGGNAFEYRLDGSGRLIRESINRFVCDGVQDFAEGVNAGTAFALDGKLRLLARDDDFSATYLDLQRWEIAISEPVAASVQMVQNNGLRWRTSVGETLRNGRHMPPGTPIDSSNADNDYPYISDIQVSDTVGWFEGRMLLRHRMPLTGEFDISVSLADFDVFGASIGLGVTRERFETGDGDSRFPTDLGGVIDANGCDIVVERDSNFLARFNDEELADLTVTKLRLKRFLDGSDWKLQAYYHDGDDWVTDEAWAGIVDDQELGAYLSLSGKVGYLRWSDFLDTVSDPYPTAGSYESRTYDAGRSVDFTRISWNEDCPAGTDVSFQVAASDDPEGPWSYGSSLTTAAGTTITSTTGRYARFKVSMTSDGSDTPVINDVQISHDGTSGSRVTRWAFDQAGNITSQVRVTDAGTETDAREYNNLNQLETSSGGWTYQYDEDGNLIEKDNGELEGCEKWEFAWNDESRLMQVKKGFYDATPSLVNELTVDYSYDQMGRLLTRDDGTNVTTYCWDEFDLFRETTGESVTEYLVPNGMIRSFIRDGELYSLHCDALGSVRTVTDSEGSAVAKVDFGAWGESLSGSVDLLPGGMPIGFVGSLGVRRDALTGLIWMRQRWYDSQALRFISRDPVGLLGGVNLYAYSSRPLNQVDPSGLGVIDGPASDVADFENELSILSASNSQIREAYAKFNSLPEAKIRICPAKEIGINISGFRELDSSNVKPWDDLEYHSGDDPAGYHRVSWSNFKILKGVLKDADAVEVYEGLILHELTEVINGAQDESCRQTLTRRMTHRAAILAELSHNKRFWRTDSLKGPDFDGGMIHYQDLTNGKNYVLDMVPNDDLTWNFRWSEGKAGINVLSESQRKQILTWKKRGN